MTTSHIGKRARIGTVLATAAAGILASAVVLPQAQAAPAAADTGLSSTVQKASVQSLMASTGVDAKGAVDHLVTQAKNLTLGNKLVKQLGDRSANFFLNPDTGKATVNVLDATAADQVRSEGLAAKLVKYTTTQLDSVKAKFDSINSVPQTAWGIDPSTNKMVLTISDAAPKAAAAKLTSYAKTFGDRVQIQHQAQAFRTHVLGGGEITDGNILCSAGFNATDGSKNYVITAGHCTQGLPSWQGVGPSVKSDFPGNDFGLIENTTGDAPGAVDLYNGSSQPITGAATPTVGQQACKSGRTTQVTCGTVQALDQTVDYGADGVVNGLIKTNVHSEPGDSGGALFDGETGLGTVSGGNDAITYYQPLQEALSAYGLSLVHTARGAQGSHPAPSQPAGCSGLLCSVGSLVP
jgi:streptogrisin D